MSTLFVGHSFKQGKVAFWNIFKIWQKKSVKAANINYKNIQYMFRLNTGVFSDGLSDKWYYNCIL